MGPESEIDRALQLQSQSAMKDLPVFSALRDMHMQEQAPEQPPRKALPPPAVLPALRTTTTTPVPEEPRMSAVTQDIEMPLVERSERTISSKARLLLAEDSLPISEDGKSEPRNKDEPAKAIRPPNSHRKSSQDNGKVVPQTREDPATKPPRDGPTSTKPAIDRKTSHTDSSPRKLKQHENPTSKTAILPLSEKAKGKAKEVPEPSRAKEPLRKKFTGFFSDSDEEEGPVIKRRKIMGGARVAENGDSDMAGSKHRKKETDKEKSHTERDKVDDVRNHLKPGDKKQKLALEERRSRQGTPAGEKSRSASTNNKEKRPKPDGVTPSRDRSTERERKIIVVAQPRKASQTSTSTRTGNEMAEDAEVVVKPDNKKKKGGDGKNKAGGKSDINPLLPLVKEGALIWKWKGVHKRVSAPLIDSFPPLTPDHLVGPQSRLESQLEQISSLFVRRTLRHLRL
jgi:hypothetical protein